MRSLMKYGGECRRSRTGLRVAATIVTGLVRAVLDGDEEKDLVVHGHN